MGISGIILLLLLPTFTISQLSFDDYVKTYDSLARLWIFGYDNPDNRGASRGCCFAKNNTTCTPCRYRATWRFKQNNPDFSSNSDYFYEVGTFSKPAVSLFETFYFEKMYSWLNVYDNDVNFFNTERVSTNAVERMQRMVYNWYGDYEFDGAYGIFNRMRAWIIISFVNRGYQQTTNFNLIIQTIVFDQYKLSNGECCTGDPEESSNLCLTPCSYYVGLNNGFSDYQITRDIQALYSSRRYTYNLTMAAPTFFLNFYGSRIRMRFLSVQDKQELDVLELRNLNLFRKRIYNFQNVVGVNKHIRANISLSLYCVGGAGVFCSKECSEFKYVDSCDNEQATPICLNGATDRRLCQNFELSCQNNPCLNNGTCKILNNNRLICVCEDGFSGQYCQEINCRSNCQGRGLCQAPNKCICEHPFFGNDCEYQECPADHRNICLNRGICFHNSSQPQCNCDKEKFTGRFCEIPVCSTDCVNGLCIKSPLRNVENKCSCYEGFSGPSCTILSEAALLNKSKNSAVLPLLIILAIATLTMIILSFLKLKGILFQPYENKMMENEEDPES